MIILEVHSIFKEFEFHRELRFNFLIPVSLVDIDYDMLFD